jgi:hypothetical protein
MLGDSGPTPSNRHTPTNASLADADPAVGDASDPPHPATPIGAPTHAITATAIAATRAVAATQLRTLTPRPSLDPDRCGCSQVMSPLQPARRRLRAHTLTERTTPVDTSRASARPPPDLLVDRTTHAIPTIQRGTNVRRHPSPRLALPITPNARHAAELLESRRVARHATPPLSLTIASTQAEHHDCDTARTAAHKDARGLQLAGVRRRRERERELMTLPANAEAPPVTVIGRRHHSLFTAGYPSGFARPTPPATGKFTSIAERAHHPPPARPAGRRPPATANGLPTGNHPACATLRTTPAASDTTPEHAETRCVRSVRYRAQTASQPQNSTTTDADFGPPLHFRQTRPAPGLCCPVRRRPPQAVIPSGTTGAPPRLRQKADVGVSRNPIRSET